MMPQIKQCQMTTINNLHDSTISDFLQQFFATSSDKMSNIWTTHGRTTTHYLQLLNEGYNNQSLFIQSKLHTPHHQKGGYTIHLCPVLRFPTVHFCGISEQFRVCMEHSTRTQHQSMFRQWPEHTRFVTIHEILQKRNFIEN
jgi:hypothetical protein